MILITLGTQDKKFYRLLDSVQKLIDNKTINEKVIVQAGVSDDYVSKDMEIFDLIPMEKFEDLIKSCDLLITHGGVGSIITGLKHNKKVIACPRLEKYGEHINDHQLQIIDNFTKSGFILGYNENDDLAKILKNVKKFKPKKYTSNVNSFIKKIELEIEK